MLIPLYTQNHKDSMSFPGISRVLNRFVERVRTPTLFGHPRKNQSRKPNAKSTKPRSSRGKKTTSVIFQRSRLDKKKKSAVGKHWENRGEEEDFPALPRREGRGRPGAPAHGQDIAPGAGAGTGEGTPAPERGPQHRRGSAGCFWGALK